MAQNAWWQTYELDSINIVWHYNDPAVNVDIKPSTLITTTVQLQTRLSSVVLVSVSRKKFFSSRGPVSRFIHHEKVEGEVLPCFLFCLFVIDLSRFFPKWLESSDPENVDLSSRHDQATVMKISFLFTIERAVSFNIFSYFFASIISLQKPSNTSNSPTLTSGNGDLTR